MIDWWSIAFHLTIILPPTIVAGLIVGYLIGRLHYRDVKREYDEFMRDRR